MRTYNVTITGKTPLIMHWDNIDWADQMGEWKDDPDNKKLSKAGDDRTPAWRWLGCVYNDGSKVVVPQENLMRSIMEGGAMVPVPGGKNGKTFKSQSQSGMMSVDQVWPLTIGGNAIKWAAVESMKRVDSFPDHLNAVRDMGFDLLVKRAKIGTSKHIRVRPIFRTWEIAGSIAVWDEQIDLKALTSILEFSGQYKGLGDWRPGGKTPGPYGTFTVEIES